MRLLVILPTYNEAKNVLPLSGEVFEQDGSLEILVVDDGSPDGTGSLVEQAARRNPRLHLLRRARKLGIGSAYRAGFRYGLDQGYERILTMDCDHSHGSAFILANNVGCYDTVAHPSLIRRSIPFMHRAAWIY